MKRAFSCCLSAAVALFVAGCGAAFEATPPPGFVELPDQSSYDWRATNADGVVLSVRVIDHEPKGEVGFWTKVIENYMRQRGGYALLGQHEVKTESGLAGVQLRFGHDEGSKPHLYYVTVFVTDSKIYVLEAGGTKELMTRDAAKLDAAIAKFRAK